MNKNFVGVLKYAYIREKEGRDFYQSKLSKVKSPEAKDLFNMLSEMEQDHMHTIEELIENIENEEQISFNLDNENEKNMFENRKQKEIISGDIDDMTSDLSIIRMAYLIEDDFMKFYSDAAKKTEDPSLKEIFESLASWEKSHRDSLNELYRSMTKNYWNEMGFEPLF